MNLKKWLALGLSGALLLMLLAACSSDSGQEAETSESPAAETETVSPSPEAADESADPAPEAGDDTETDTLALTFTFLDGDGAALADAAVQLTMNGDQADYPTDSNGVLSVGGLPRTGTVELVLTDSAGAQLGTLELRLTEGSVIDVADNGDSTAVLTILSDTVETSLTVTVGEDSVLQCALDLGAEDTAA